MGNELKPVDKKALKTALQTIIADEVEKREAPQKKSVSAQSRRTDMKALVESADPEFLDSMRSALASYIDEHVTDAQHELGQLSPEAVDSLAGEWLDLSKLIDFFTMRKEAMRERVFAAIDAKFAEQEAKGIELERPPHQMPDKLTSEALGVSFCREKGGRKAPTLNWDQLRSELSPEAYEACCEVVHHEPVEAWDEYRPSEELLMKALQDGLISMEQVRKAVVAGDWSSPAFTIRKN